MKKHDISANGINFNSAWVAKQNPDEFVKTFKHPHLDGLPTEKRETILRGVHKDAQTNEGITPTEPATGDTDPARAKKK